ncbi:hypothetical protein V8G54_011726 [Vigna mungo]|uniref:Uncharacterized protein n=1 Tax=Vigna mungo TaxID=3915 RepID=A0AAQ3NPP2_VIGMU
MTWGERSLDAKKSSLWNSRSPWWEEAESMSLTATGTPARVPANTGPKPPWPRREEKELVARRRTEKERRCGGEEEEGGGGWWAARLRVRVRWRQRKRKRRRRRKAERVTARRGMKKWW